MIRPVIIIGSGGHAKVVIEALRCSGIPILGHTDAEIAKESLDLAGVPYLGSDEALNGHDPNTILLANGIGSTGDPATRIRAFKRLHDRGFQFTRIIHPSTVIAGDADLGEGVQIMAGAIIQPGCRIGINAIVNTGAHIDHDCDIGEHVHVAPGAVLCGEVTIGTRCHIGAGAVITQKISVGADCLIAAGTVVTTMVKKGTRVAGVPARNIGT